MIDNKIYDYCIEKSNTPSSTCDELEIFTKENHALSQMLCGKLEASFLGFLIRSHNVKSVLELGTFTGYSSLAMAEQLPSDGKIITIDKNKKINKIASDYWNKSEHGKKITAIFGAGVEQIPLLKDKFDMVFIDADKANYLNYLKMTLPLLNPGGIIVVDNVLWSGRVVESIVSEEDKSTIHIQALNDFVANSDDLYGTMIPLRDGIFLITKN
jgi:predicted O-methyltransferase YrrM